MMGRSALLARRASDWVHLAFHDWDLLSGHRRLALWLALTRLGRRYGPLDLGMLPEEAPERWAELPADRAIWP
jgi:hypothetical protein